ncbi:MAG TPA: hypothetical protein VKY65_04075 [Alphaproteobacteria bacterium]|nr:hypothetical protein [Alphaproteobacteria bacterium]
MPFLGVDPWRWQYFEGQAVPDGIVIPIDDATAWELYPAHRWVYNKLLICETQGLPHGPHGTMPRHYPVFSKPIYNMRGMGTGGGVIATEADYLAALQPGHLWMPLFTGRHVSTDVALVAGRPRWWRHTTGEPRPGGTFDYWTVHADPDPMLEDYLGAWVARHLAGFSGIVNFETIGGRIVECHLRMAEQWLDLNGPGWLAAVVGLYAGEGWRFAERERREGFSVVLFGEHEVRWRIDRRAVRRYLDDPEISSIQITFEDDVAPEHHAMPPGGFRLAIVNCWGLAAGRAVREELRRLFDAGAGAARAAGNAQ